MSNNNLKKIKVVLLDEYSKTSKKQLSKLKSYFVGGSSVGSIKTQSTSSSNSSSI